MALPKGSTIARVRLDYQLAGSDSDVEREQYLTVVPRGGQWLLAGDTDAAESGLTGESDIWDLGPVRVVHGKSSLVLGDASSKELRQLAAEADRGVSDVGVVWKRPWSRHPVIVFPRSQADMREAGVPLKAPVAGMAMGLIMDEESGKYAILSDIAGAEDHYGDMDFKVAGSVDGITALQMDIKVSGITMDIMRKALEQARVGRLSILQKMQDTLSVARENVSAHAPRIVTIRIPVDKIRDVIGPGGKMIRSIIERTGVKIDVEDDGRVNVASADEASAQKAIGIIQELTATPELNKTYMGKVQRITDFGAFVEIMPGLDGLLHVSEIAHYRVKDVRDELKEGEQVMVKVINIDPSGKIRLSRKALIDPPEGGVPPAEGGSREGGERPRREGGRPDGGRGGYRGDRDRGGDRGPRGGHDRRPEGGHERRPLPDNVSAEVSGAARTDEPSGGEND